MIKVKTTLQKPRFQNTFPTSAAGCNAGSPGIAPPGLRAQGDPAATPQPRDGFRRIFSSIVGFF
ncbi:MAG TPA: hypothetical protein VH934_13925 [Xanthobacteraceae bacterium]